MSVYESCVADFGANLTTELLQCVSDSTEAVSELAEFGNSSFASQTLTIFFFLTCDDMLGITGESRSGRWR